MRVQRQFGRSYSGFRFCCYLPSLSRQDELSKEPEDQEAIIPRQKKKSDRSDGEGQGD